VVVLILLAAIVLVLLVLIYKTQGSKTALFALGAFIAGLLLSHFITTV
jgi:hypothetical protein